MRYFILVAVALASLAFTPDGARADYVCNVSLGQSSSNLGDHGYITMRLNTLPDCGGTTIGYFYLCSEGAQDAICPLSTQWHWGQPALFALWESLRSAARDNDRVSRWSVQCGTGGGNNCIGSLTFYAN